MMLRNIPTNQTRRKLFHAILPSISNLNDTNSTKHQFHHPSNIQTPITRTLSIDDKSRPTPILPSSISSKPLRKNRDINDEGIIARVPVKSIYAARTIDINAIVPKLVYKIKPDKNETTNKVSSLFHKNADVSSSPVLPSPTTYRHMGKNCVILQYPPEETGGIERYTIVFRFGSVVFINVQPSHADAILQEIKSFQGNARPISEQKEYFEIAIQPSIAQPTVTPDYVKISHIDMNAVSVVSTIMAQTVAFDSYNIIVDELLAEFAKISAHVEKTGNFDMEKQNLFRVIAQNNSLFIDMVSKIGVLERSDTAWNFSQYEAIYQGMREEFELDDRFDHVEFKLNMIQQNTKFFLEILHNQKTQTLEYVIIVLIAFECILMCLDMTG